MAKEQWKQLPEEDSRPFAAFAFYRDMDPSIRTIRAACELFHGDEFDENDYRRWTGYSAKYRWKKRARAWDEFRDEQAREAEIEALREMREEQAQRSRRLQRIADKSIERELAKFEADPEYQLNPALILQFATQGASMERVVRGEPTEILGKTEPRKHIQIEWGKAPNDGTEGVKEDESNPAEPTSGPVGDHQ